MNLSTNLHKAYSEDKMSAHEAQHLAELIAWGPVVFQTTRLMMKFGVLKALRESDEGLTETEVARECGISPYAAKVLLEASLSIGTIIINPESDRYTLTRAGWYLLVDPSHQVDMDFNHDVNYIGWHRLEESLREGRPAGLEHFGPWATIYEGLSSLPEQVQRSWFGFDHFYSDNSFAEALEIVFRKHSTRSLYDVGGNTGKWALQCVSFDLDVEVTILDLPQQIELMRENIAGKPGAERIKGYGINMLDSETQFPQREAGLDAIWMSQFLDCFGEEEVVSILQRARSAMMEDTRLYIMETFWDRQKYESAAFALTMTSLYFTALANGNSKMYHSADMLRLINEAGLEVETIYDHIGYGHSILVCKKNS